MKFTARVVIISRKGESTISKRKLKLCSNNEMINIFVCLSKLDIIDNGDKKIKRDLASFQIKDVAYFLTKFLSTFSFAN